MKRYMKVEEYETYDGRSTRVVPNIKNVIVDALIALFAVIILLNSFFINNEYEKSVVTNLGTIDRVVGEGLHFKIPFVETNNRADLRIEEYDVPMSVAMGGGSNIVGLTMTVNHQINPIDDSVLIDLYKQFGSNFGYESRILNKMAIDRSKSLVSKNTIESYIEHRDDIRLKVKTVILGEAEKYGINIVDVQFSDMAFSDSFKSKLQQVGAARAAAAEAEQQARREAFLADKAIETARGQAQSKIQLSDAEAHAIKVKSIEKAEAIKREKLAEAEGIEALNKASANAKGLAELRMAEAMQNWSGDVPQFMMGEGESGSLFPFMNVKDFASSK